MRIILLLLVLVLRHFPTNAQVSLEQLNLVPGQYRVGFSHHTSIDSSRTYQRIFDWTNQSVDRPIPISIWYPSKDVPASAPFKVLEYMRILKEEEEWEHLPDEQILNWFYYPNTPANQNHLQASTGAHTLLHPAKGKFPIIIYAPSYEASSIENFALCEFLASHGYVVISSPSRGTNNRFLEGATDKDLETQARDLEFLLKESMSLPYTDLDKTTVMGFSFGGLSQVLTQMRNDQIDAMVSLDGSIKYQFCKLQKSPFYDINQVDIPFIHFSQKEIPNVVLKEDNIDPSLNDEFEFFDSLRYSDAYHYQFHHLTHAYFSTLGVLFQTRDPRQDKSDKEIMASYQWVCQYTLNFLDAYLKDNESALAFLNRTTDENTGQAELISKTTKRALTRNLTFQDFNDLARDQDYEKLEQLYDSIRKQHPTFKIPEGNLNNLGLQLIFHPSKSDFGLRVFRFATTLYPNSANLWDSLAEGYLYLGKKQLAIESFEKSLKLDPGNSNAENRLKELEER